MPEKYHTIRLEYDDETKLCTVWFRGRKGGSIPIGVDLDERTFLPMLSSMLVNDNDGTEHVFHLSLSTDGVIV